MRGGLRAELNIKGGMPGTIDSSESTSDRTIVERIARASFARPKLILGSWIVLIAVSLFGVRRLSIETNTESVLDHRSEAWRFYQRSQDLFGIDEALTVAVRSDRAFDREAMALIFDLTQTLSSLDGVRRVDSIASIPVIESGPNGDIRLDPPMFSHAPMTQEEADAIGVRVLSDRIAPDTLASNDGKVLALNVLLDAHGVGTAKSLLNSMSAKLPPEVTWMSGVPVFRVETDERTRAELISFIPLTVLAMAVLLFALFRSISATALPFAVSSSGTCVVMGAMGALDVPLTISTVILPSVFLAMGCAYSMHLLMETVGTSEPSEIAEAIGTVARPLALSGLTTAIGFVAVAVVPIDALRQLGGFGALGTFTLVTATLTAGPAFLAMWPSMTVSSRFVDWVRSSLQPSIVGLVLRNPRAVVIAWAIIAIGFGAGAFWVRVETDVTKWFPKGGFVRDSYDNIRTSLSGISPMNVVVTTQTPDGIMDPQVLTAIDQLSAALRRNPDVGKAISIADPLREIHGEFLGDPEDPLPLDRRLIAQYLIVLESKEQFRDLVSVDRSTGNVVLRINNNGSEHLLGVSKFVEEWWGEHGVPGVSVRATGIMYEFARAQRAIAVGQLQGLALDLATISLILFGIFRIPRIALIALVPNALPVILIFGALGFAGIPLDAGTVVVGNLALGIAVDESVFILSAFLTQGSASTSRIDAIAGAVRQIFPALLATTTAVAVSYAILTFSDFAFTQKLGALTAGVMVVCVGANVTLLPALLMLLETPERIP